ncbi:MAG: cobalamin B12-binding domain-containing protein [Verrucomicrobiales bacterium]
MQEQIAEFIRSKKGEMAAWITDEYFRSRPELESRWGQMGRRRCIEDTEYHFSYLVEAVRFGYPELFLDYVAWAKILLASLNIPSRDLEQNLHLMKTALQSMAPAEVATAAHHIIDHALKVLPQMPTEPPSFLDPQTPHYQLASEWMDHLLSHRTREARNLVLNAIKADVSVSDIYQYVFTPCMHEVGRLWQIRAINEAEEHYCSQITQTMLALLTSDFEVAKVRRSVVGFCVANEQHDMGVRLLLDCFSLHGWDTVCLGSNVPTRNLETVLRTWTPDVVAISTTMTFHLTHVVAAIQALRSTPIEKQPIILVGGRPFSICPELWRKVGADAAPKSCTEAMTNWRQLMAISEQVA